jgi:hypothetical protein
MARHAEQRVNLASEQINDFDKHNCDVVAPSGSFGRQRVQAKVKEVCSARKAVVATSSYEASWVQSRHRYIIMQIFTLMILSGAAWCALKRQKGLCAAENLQQQPCRRSLQELDGPRSTQLTFHATSLCDLWCEAALPKRSFSRVVRTRASSEFDYMYSCHFLATTRGFRAKAVLWAVDFLPPN